MTGDHNLMKSRTYYAKRNVITGCISKVIYLLLPFCTRTFITYYLGVKYLGLNNLFVSLLQMLNLAELGVSSAIVFCMYKPIANDDNKTICALLNFYKITYRVIGLVILTLGLCIIPFLDNFIKGEVPNNVNIVFVYVLFLLNTVLGYLLYSYKSSILVAYQRVDITNLITTIIVFLQNLIQIISLIVFSNYYIFAIIMPICTIVNNLLIARITSKLYPNIICKGKLDKEILIDLKYKISGLMVSKLCMTSRNSLDNVIIASFIGLNSVAIYGNYYMIMSGVQSILSIATVSITASVGNSIALETPKKNYDDMMKFCFIYSWISGIATCCLLNLYQPFMKIWMGEDMLFPFNIVICMCIYFYSLTLGDIRTVYMTGAGLWWESRFRSILEALTNIVLNVVLGKMFGVIGVVIATIISILVINFGYGSTIIFKHYFKISYKSYYLYNFIYACVIAVSCLLTYWVCEFIVLPGVISLVCKFIICLVISNLIYIIIYRNIKYYSDAKLFVRTLIKIR